MNSKTKSENKRNSNPLVLQNPSNDLQSELLLLRSCMGITKLFSGLMMCQSIHMEEATMLFDPLVLQNPSNDP